MVIVSSVASQSFETAIKDAVMDGPSGERRLVEMLASSGARDKVIVAAALGDAQGDEGVPVLRSLLATTAASDDLRCAALLALAKRAGATASDVLTEHLTGTPAAVADYAIIALAKVGDGRAWHQVHAVLQLHLDRRPPPVVQPLKITPGLRQFHVLVTIAYLARHLGESHTERTAQLVTTIRSRFGRFHKVEQDWLSTHWPGISPDGAPPDQITPPDPEPFRSLVQATHLFGPVF
jgi:hypothetical protein